MNRVIEEASRSCGIHAGVAVVNISPAIKDLVRNKVMPLYFKLAGTEHFEEMEKFLEAIGCLLEKHVLVEPNEVDEHEKLGIGV